MRPKVAAIEDPLPFSFYQEGKGIARRMIYKVGCYREIVYDKGFPRLIILEHVLVQAFSEDDPRCIDQVPAHLTDIDGH